MQSERGEFSNLRSLNLSNNLIQDLDSNTCKSLVNLTYLNLQQNRLKTISPHIKAIMELKVLILNKN